MATTEQFLVQEADEPRMSCKSRKWFLVALLCTITTVLLLIVIIVLAVTLVQSQTPQYEGSTMESTTCDLSATTAKVPLAVTTNTTVTMESITSDLSATTSKVLLGVTTSTGVTSQMELSKQGTKSSLGSSSRGCCLPESWKGKWFQSGFQSPIEIKARSMDTKGSCYESSGDNFLFVDQPNNCHRCIVINERHQNVLQYKESMYCEDEDTLENLCSRITGDVQLHSLFRLDGTPEDCPFRGSPLTFTYNRGYGECKYPLSHVDSCTENSRLLLRYQACPEVPKTESTAEEIQCIGQWQEVSHHYLIAKVQHRLIASFEDSYRCFAFEKIKGTGGATAGYKVAQSGDATCSGVSSPTEGARTFTFTKVEGAAPECKFPIWFSSHRWHSLDGKNLIRFYHKNTKFHVLDESGSVSTDNKSEVSTGGASNFLVTGAQISCLNVKETSGGRHVAIQANYLEECKSMTLCLHIYTRGRHVIEIKAAEVLISDDNTFACSKEPSSTEGTVQTYVMWRER